MQGRFKTRRVLPTLIATIVCSSSFGAHSSPLFNLTGSRTGRGDVLGVYLIADAYARRTGQKSLLLVDGRARQVLTSSVPGRDFDSATSRLRLIGPSELPVLDGISVIFDCFVRGRAYDPTAITLPAQATAPILVKTQDLHYGSTKQAEPVLNTPYLSEVRTASRTWFFAPAGLGVQGGGVLPDPEIEPYRGLSKERRRKLAQTRFNSPLNAILARRRFVDAKLGFLYGLSNLGRMIEWTNVDRFRNRFSGQVLTYVRGAERRLGDGPLLVLTPNGVDDVRHELSRPRAGQPRFSPDEPVEVLSLAELSTRNELARKVYIVSVGPLNRAETIALLASTDEPPIVEGDGMLSSAVQLGQPFGLFRSPWNYFAIADLKSALKAAGAKFVDDVYPVPDAPPNFFDINLVRADAGAFERMAAATPTFDRALIDAVSLAADGTRELPDLFDSTPDPYLKLSILLEMQSAHLEGPEAIARRLQSVPNAVEVLANIETQKRMRTGGCAVQLEFQDF